MAQRTNRDLFQRLTNLFRSGPVVKRKIRFANDASVSSANDVFKKTLSQVYSTAMSAYGTYDRMARYSDFSEMEYCLAEDTLIAVPGGYRTIKELADEYGTDKEFIVYTYDHNLKQIVPAIGKHARQTRVDHAFKVTFDSGKEIIGTGNHRLMLRDGTYRRIDELCPGDSMMPFYRRDLFEKGKKLGGYSWIYTMDPEARNGWKTEHKLIAEWALDRKLSEDEVVHHKNFVKTDNRPENLDVMHRNDHYTHHALIFNDKKWDKETNGQWIEHFRKTHSKRMQENNPATRRDITFGRILEIAEREGFNSAKICKVLDTDLNVIKSRLHQNGFKDFQTFAAAYDPVRKNHGWNNQGDKKHRYDRSLTFKQVCDTFEGGMTLNSLAQKLSSTPAKILDRIKANGYLNYSDFKENYQNHKVVSVEYFGEIPLYDLTVDGYKNFATDSVISHNTPEISSALDIYSEETVSNDDKGRVLHVFSENRQIERLLEELFYDTLNVEFNLTPWVRDLVKYGDFFLFNDVSPNMGVVNVFPIPVNEIEREEGYDPHDPLAVRFRWITQGNQILENWQVTHFRLLGNDAFLPYGTSVLESARRIWRQLILIEDAMLVYRVVRSPERRVFYIDVANVPPEDVPNYMEAAKSVLRSNQVIDSGSGRVDLRYNPLPVWSETPVPLLDGRTVTIRKLAEEFEEGKDNWVYSLQEKTHQVVPGKVAWCGKNYTAECLVKVWLDDDTWCMTAPEHPFVMRDGSSKRADELTVGDSLMPLYRKLSKKNDGDYVDDYEKVYNPKANRFEYTHKLIARSSCLDHDRIINDSVAIHHENHCKWNNEPTNLRRMGWWEHKKHHANANQTDDHRRLVSLTNRKYQKAQKMGANYNSSTLHQEHNVIRRAAQRRCWNNEETRQARCHSMRWSIPDGVIDYTVKRITENPDINREMITQEIRSNVDLIGQIAEKNSHNNRKVEKFHVSAVLNELKRNGVCSGWGDLKKKITDGEFGHRNHTVTRIETINHPSDVYCMTVVGPMGEEDRHNFAIVTLGDTPSLSLYEDVTLPASKKQPGGHLGQGIFVKNSVDEDYFIPVRGADGGTKIDTLAGGTNVTAIEDVEYIQKKMFSALKIPKAYLGYDESIGSKATLSQEDIRFSRTISRIQRTILSELNKIAIIHLFSHGYQDEDLLDFELNLNNPSTVAQQQKLEIYRTRFEIASSAPEGLVDRRWIRKNIMNLTDDEIELIEQGRIKDRRSDLDLEKITSEPPPESAPTGGGSAGGFGPEFTGEFEDVIGPPGEEAFEPTDREEQLAGFGGGEEEAGGPEAGSEETEDLFAGQIVRGLPGLSEDDDLDQDLIDEDDDDFDFAKLSINDVDAPVKAQSQVDRYLYNRKRRRHSGPAATGMPDFNKMVSHNRPGDSLKDPYDMHKLNQTDPFKEGLDSIDVFLNRSTTHQARMTTDLRRTLKDLETNGIVKQGRNPKIITESENSSFYFDEEDESEGE